MSEQLSTCRYLSLILFNSLLAMAATFAMGLLYAHSKELDMLMLQLDLSEQNKSKIFTHIKSNCTELFVVRLKFDLGSAIDLCDDYYLSMTITRTIVILSILYHAYLLCTLFNAYRLSLAITATISIFLFDIPYIIDEWTLHSIQLTLITIGFGMTISHHALSDSDNDLEKKRSKYNN